MNNNEIVSINVYRFGDIKEFTSLSIHQSLADTCNGSFGYRHEGSQTLAEQIKFHDNIMHKTLTILIGTGFAFYGYVHAVRMHNEDGIASEYIISFAGQWSIYDQHQECHAFPDMKFNEIISKITKDAYQIKDWPNDAAINAKPLYWTVQLNKTKWEQIKFLAAREGAWLYYDGKEMRMAAPGANKMTLTKGIDIFGIAHSKNTVAAPVNFTGFNTFSGDLIATTIDAVKPQGIHKSSVNAGTATITSADGSVHITTAFDDEQLQRKGNLYQKAKVANSVIFTATTRETGITLGTLLKIQESDDNNDSHEFIVTQIAHSAPTPNSYTAYLTMVPSSVEVPPYTNPFLYTPADKTHGIVMNNHDVKHKQDRVMVNLPWMPKNTCTCWMDVLTGYAGKGKGHIWLPEIDEEVLVDFIGGDIERPFVSGAIFSNKNQSERESEGNHIKSTTTGSGRGFVIDDKEGKIRFQDNKKGEFPNNALVLVRNSEKDEAQLQSAADDQNYVFVQLVGKNGIVINVQSGGVSKYSITLDKEKNSITINSAGTIDLNADDTINLNAGNINLNASKELKLNGTQTGVKVDGQKVEITATTDIKATANANLTLSATAVAKMSGTAQMEVSSDGLAVVKGGLVTIN